MEPLIRAVLSKLIGEEDAEKIEIISNDAKVEDGGKSWEIVFRNPDSGFVSRVTRCHLRDIELTFGEIGTR